MRPSLTAGATLGFVVVAASAPAFSQELTVENTGQSGTEIIHIPLTGTVDIDGAGDVAVTCDYAGSREACQTIGQQGQTGNPAAVAFDATSPTSATVGTAVQMKYNVTTATEATCVRTSSPSNATWNTDGVRVAAGGGQQTQNVSFAAAGSVQLSVKCRNDDGAASVTPATTTVSVTDNGGGGQSSFNNCVLPGASFSTDLANTALQRPVGYELVKPLNLTAYNRTWDSQFNGVSWPNENAQLAAIGSWSAQVTGAWSGSASAYPRNTTAAGMYITIPFTVTSAQARAYSFQIKEAQPTSGHYSMSRWTDEVTATISPCAGDLRPKNASGPDIYVKYCRTGVNAGTVTSLPFSVSATGGSGSCNLAPGDYWFTIAMARSSQPDFLEGTRNGCKDAQTSCEANVKLLLQ